MEFILIVFFALTAITFVYLFYCNNTIFDILAKYKRLIQNLESSIDTQKRMTKILSAELWKLKNPPQYKTGDRINYPQNPEQDVIITDVEYVDSEPYKSHFKINCEEPLCGRWSYTAINLKTGEKAFL